jgi:hypothetical protein
VTHRAGNRRIHLGGMGHRRPLHRGCNAARQHRRRRGTGTCLRREVQGHRRSLGQPGRAEAGRLVVARRLCREGRLGRTAGLELPRAVVGSGQGLRRVAHRGVVGRAPGVPRCRGRRSAASFAGRDSQSLLVRDGGAQGRPRPKRAEVASIGLDRDQWARPPWTYHGLQAPDPVLASDEGASS